VPFGVLQGDRSYADSEGVVAFSGIVYFNAVYTSANLVQFDLTGTLALNLNSVVSFTITPSGSQMELSVVDNSEKLSLLAGSLASSQWFPGNNTLVLYSLSSPETVEIGYGSLGGPTATNTQVATSTQATPTLITPTTNLAPLIIFPSQVQPVSWLKPGAIVKENVNVTNLGQTAATVTIDYELVDQVAQSIVYTNSSEIQLAAGESELYQLEALVIYPSTFEFVITSATVQVTQQQNAPITVTPWEVYGEPVTFYGLLLIMFIVLVATVVVLRGQLSQRSSTPTRRKHKRARHRSASVF
jgi:hypothetical protein